MCLVNNLISFSQEDIFYKSSSKDVNFTLISLFQYAWRLFAASPSFRSSATWKPHQISSLASYNKKYSNYTRGGSPAPGSPQTGRKSMTYFMRKLQNNKAYGDGDSVGPMRSSIGATIPSAIELRDNRSHSEGNLLLIGSDNLDDNQATIVSLPPAMMSDGTESKLSKLHSKLYVAGLASRYSSI